MTHTRLATLLLCCMACACASGTPPTRAPLIPQLLPAQQLEAFASKLPADTAFSFHIPRLDRARREVDVLRLRLANIAQAFHVELPWLPTFLQEERFGLSPYTGASITPLEPGLLYQFYVSQPSTFSQAITDHARSEFGLSTDVVPSVSETQGLTIYSLGSPRGGFTWTLLDNNHALLFLTTPKDGTPRRPEAITALARLASISPIAKTLKTHDAFSELTRRYTKRHTFLLLALRPREGYLNERFKVFESTRHAMFGMSMTGDTLEISSKFVQNEALLQELRRTGTAQTWSHGELVTTDAWLVARNAVLLLQDAAWDSEWKQVHQTLPGLKDSLSGPFGIFLYDVQVPKLIQATRNPAFLANALDAIATVDFKDAARLTTQLDQLTRVMGQDPTKLQPLSSLSDTRVLNTSWGHVVQRGRTLYLATTACGIANLAKRLTQTGTTPLNTPVGVSLRKGDAAIELFWDITKASKILSAMISDDKNPLLGMRHMRLYTPNRLDTGEAEFSLTFTSR